MKKILLIFAASILLVSCNEDSGYTVKGTIDESLNGKMLYVSHLTDNNASVKIDSTTISEGKFNLALPETDKQYLAFISIEGVRTNLPYIAENSPVNLTVYKDSMRTSLVDGGANNAIFSDYIAHVLKTNRMITENQQDAQKAMQESEGEADIEKYKTINSELLENDKLYKMKIAKEHKNSMVAVMALTDLTNVKTIPVNDIRTMYADLSADVKATPLGKNLSQMLASKSATEIGARAPEFAAPTPDGDMLSLTDALGKVTIVDFWASWCKPCRIENPNVVRVYEKYHDKGLNIIGVSLDKKNAKERWLKAIADDNLTWQHVSNLEFWQEPVAKLYNVRAIPATFILDEEGNIIAKNLRGKALEDKMAELLD